MRKAVFFILLATTAMPALASVQNEDRGGDRSSVRAERSERGGGESGQSSQRAARSERAGSADSAPAVQRVERSERVRAPRAERSQPVVQSSNQSSRRSSNDYSGRRNRTENRSSDGVRSAPVFTRDSSDGVTNWRARERRVATSPTIPVTTSSDGVTASTSPLARSYRERHRDDHGRRWSSDWRHDHRYNWRSHRSRYSSLYRLGRYYDPFGYGYNRFSIGFSLWPSYYGSNYWLDDPWQYRLPPAYGPYRWIRYYDDALLVNIYSGEVVDVIHNFFW